MSEKKNSVFEELVRRIDRLQSGGTVDSIRAVGADPGNQVGASYVSLKTLASKYERDEDVALLLWNRRKREEQIVACLLLPRGLNREKIMQLMATCVDYEIAGYVGSLYLCEREDFPDMAISWMDTEEVFAQVALLTALARYIILHKEDNRKAKELLESAVERSYGDEYVRMTAERYRIGL